MSHIAAVGFDAPSEEAFRTLVRNLIDRKKGEVFYCEGDDYYIVLPDTHGAQIWLQISAKKEILGFRPHFLGSGKMKVTVTESESASNSMEGSWKGICNPAGSKEAELEGLFTFKFDCPDFRTFVPPFLPWFATVQLCAFAERVEFNTPGSFGDPVFIPMQTENSSGVLTPVTMARMSGKVLHASEFENELTGQHYRHALVATQGGEVDLVWPQQLGVPIPEAGMAVRTQAWISGRFSERPRLRGRGLRGLLFGRR